MRFLFWMMCLTSSLSFAKSPHAGIFSSVNGTVSIVRTQEKIKASLGDKIFQGDSIVTKENSSAKVLYRDNSMIEVKASTNFLIETVAVNEEKKSVFSLIFGKIRALVGSREEDESYDIKAGGTVLGIRGTTVLAEAKLEDDTTTLTSVASIEGHLNVITVNENNVQKTTEIKAGEQVNINNSDGSSTVTTFDADAEQENTVVENTSNTVLETEEDSMAALGTVITQKTTDASSDNQKLVIMNTEAANEVVVINADSAQTLSTPTNTLSLTINVTDLSVYAD